jgi:hypothetical protein
MRTQTSLRTSNAITFFSYSTREHLFAFFLKLWSFLGQPQVLLPIQRVVTFAHLSSRPNGS